MSDVLSQSEIDALLSAINEGTLDVDNMEGGDEEEAGKVREYDFRTANKFSKEQIRTLSLIFENFARLFSTYLSGTLRSSCEVDVISVEESKYMEFTNALPTPVLLSILRVKPLHGSSVLELSPSVAYAMINRVLGGVIPSHETPKAFTEIEVVIIERLMRQILPLLNESWARVMPMDARLDRIETNAQFAQIVAGTETIAIITLNVKIGDVDGLMNFCIPYISIEPFRNQLTTRALFTTGTESGVIESSADDIQAKIVNTPMTVKAVFDDTPLSVGEVLSLNVGDVITLDHNVHNPLTVKVGHLNKFHATLGVKDKKYAVRLAGIIREEEFGNE